MSFPRYQKYKESGVEWLGHIPEHWTVISIKWLSPVKRGASPRPIDDAKYFDEEGEFAWVRIADVSACDGVLKDTTQRLSQLGSSLSVKIKPGELFVSIAGTVGKPCVSAIKACIHDGFVYFPTLKIDPQFFYRIFEAGACYGGLGKWGTQLNLNTDTIGSIRVALPPADELKQIIEFLDRETGKIDALVAEQQRLMTLLKEKRQAVISHAVTKGLNPKAALKPSGIEWLNDIPAHWRVVAFKHLARTGAKTFTDGDWIEAPYITDNGVRLLQTGNVGIGIFKEQGFRYVSDETFGELQCTEVKPRDVLICRLDGPVGRACIAPDLGVRMITSVDNAILKVADDVLPEFVVSLLSSVPWISWIDALCRVGGGFRLRISRSQLGEIRVPLPPLDEQLAIQERLGSMANEFDTLTAEARRAIELLQERRTALISAAVTGQIDVRGVAHAKPENHLVGTDEMVLRP